MDWARALISVIWGGKDSLHEGTTYAWIMIGATLLVLFGQVCFDRLLVQMCIHLWTRFRTTRYRWLGF